MSTLPIRLREERARLKLSQTAFAAHGNVGKHSQINYESGKRHPDSNYLIAISALGADVNYILTGQRGPISEPEIYEKTIVSEIVEEFSEAAAVRKVLEGHDIWQAPVLELDKKSFAAIPRYDATLAAGDGVANDTSNAVDHLAFSCDWLDRMGIHQNEACLLAVKGDSMKPALHDGDLVLIDRRKTSIQNGHIYAFNDLDGMSRVKRLTVVAGKAIIIASDNSPTTPEERTGEDMNAISEGIIGEVVWSGHSWK